MPFGSAKPKPSENSCAQEFPVRLNDYFGDPLGFDPPHSIPPLPCYLADQTVLIHPRQIALHGCATGSGHGLSHWGGYQGPLRESFSQGARGPARQLSHDAFCSPHPRFNIVKCSGVGKIWGSGCGATVTAGQPAIENGRPHDCYAMGTFG